MQELNELGAWIITEVCLTDSNGTLNNSEQFKYEMMANPSTGKRGAHIEARQIPTQAPFVIPKENTPLWFDAGLWLIGRTEDNEGWMLVRVPQIHDLFPNDPWGDVYIFTRKKCR